VAYYYSSDAGTSLTAWSATWNFKTAITAPLLNTPTDGAPAGSVRPPLDWGDVTGGASYQIQIDNTSDFSSPLVYTTVVASTFTPVADLPSGTTLYWRVRANALAGSYGPSAWSTVWSFTTP
jgi:hypothetical protein